MKHWLRCVACFFALMLAGQNAFAVSLNSGQFAVYRVNSTAFGLTLTTYYVVPKRSVLLLHGDIVTPILFMPNVMGYSFMFDTNGATVNLQEIPQNAESVLAMAGPNVTVQLSDYKLFSGDFNGDGQSDLLLQGAGGKSSIVLANGSSGPTVLHNFGASLDQGSMTLTVADYDRDGLADLKLTPVAGGAQETWLAEVDGSWLIGGAVSGANITQVGAIAGKFRVNEQGAASYGLDILTAQGTAGVTPQVSLNYSSEGGRGIAGHGWSLGGLSTITRCRQTLSQDGRARGITLTDEDRFCLDGQRLIKVSDGASVDEYRTEVDSYAIVQAHGPDGDPAYFTVSRKDGSLSYYGNGNGSRVEVGGKNLSWSISRFQDSAGNPIRFSYQNIRDGANNTIEQRVQRIDYAYGSDTGAVGNSDTYLEFIYQSRPDVSIGYVAGYEQRHTQRLVRISSIGDGQALRDYHLVYRKHDEATRQSYVARLYECVSNDCLTPTKFTWTMAKSGFTSPSTAISSFGSEAPLAFRTFDMNGDGKSDIAYVEVDIQTSDEDYYFAYRLSDGSQFIGGDSWENFIPDKGVFNWNVIDFNNDGLQDLMVSRKGTATWQIYLGNGSGLNGSGIETHVPHDLNTQAMDFNSDGLVDVVYTSGSSLRFRPLQRVQSGSQWIYQFGAEQTIALVGGIELTPEEPFNPFPSRLEGFTSPLRTPTLADFNGDGKADVLGKISYTGWYPCTAPFFDLCMGPTEEELAVFNATDGGDFVWSQSFPAYYGSIESAKLGDINGDGLTDLVIRKPDGDWALYLNTGNSFVETSVVGVLPEEAQLVDHNNDGYPDLIYPEPNELWVRHYDPAAKGFGGAQKTGITFQNKNTDRYAYADMDGDGHIDLLRAHFYGAGNNQVIVHKSRNAGIAVDRITAIDNGMGNVTTVTYKPLTDGAVYARSNDANAVGWDLPGGTQTLGKTHPVFDYHGASYVVAKVQSSAPAAAATPGNVDLAAKSSLSYFYSGAQMQASGRGWLGFREVRTTDHQSGVITTTRYRQDFPFAGSPEKTEVKTAGGIVMKLSENRYAFHGAQQPPYRTYANEVIETTRDPVTGAELTHSVVSKTQDDWGNPTNITTSVYSAEDHVNYLTRVVTANNYGTGSNQVLGRLLQSVATHYRAGIATPTAKTARFTYYNDGDSKDGLLKTETIEPDTALAVTTVYEYNSFGNKTVVTIKPGGPEAPTTNARSTEYLYDTKQRFVNETKKAFFNGSSWVPQSVETVISRNKFGLPLQVNGLNGVETSFQYDVMGRERQRGDNTGAWAASSYGRGGIPGAAYHVATQVSGGGGGTEYFDVLGRTIAKTQTGFDGSTSWARTEYDSSSRVVHQSQPYFDGGYPRWTINQYDAFGRLTKQTFPVTGGGEDFTTISYAGLVTTTTNALNQVKKEYRNAAGELVKVVDHLDGSVHYSYDATGQLTVTGVRDNDASPTKTIYTSILYDQLGRKIKMVDPDKGTWFYQHNAFGELTYQYKVTSAVSYSGDLTAALADGSVAMQRTEMDYDRRGRMIARRDYRQKSGGSIDSQAAWTYDTAANGLGQLASSSGGGLAQTYQYDDKGRLTTTVSTHGGDSYQQDVRYDSVGRVDYQTDALHLGSGIQNRYNLHGYLERIEDLDSGQILYQVQQVDARGNVRTAVLGNGQTSSWVYDEGSGLLTEQSASVGAAVLQRINYSWDALGNMTSRWDRSRTSALNAAPKDVRQSFCYDGLNRLTRTTQGSTVPSCGQEDQTYDAFGNITWKAGIGAYTYGSAAARPHAVATTADGVSYQYDNNGNLTGDSSGRALAYTVFDKPTEITKGNHKVEFAYGADLDYFKRVDTDTGSGQVTTTYRLGGLEKVVKPDGSYEMRRYAGGVGLWTHKFTALGVETALDKQYMYKDVLGSITMITDHLGVIKQQQGFNAWGERVDVMDLATVLATSQFLPVAERLTTRGFTGHDMLDAVGIIHMGGRIYDPRLGRFLQADPFVQAPSNTQSYNRYSYVFNNPLTLTDPSGYFSLGDKGKKNLGPIKNIVSVILIAFEQVWAAAIWNGVMTAAQAIAFDGSWMQGIVQGVIAGVSTMAFTGLDGGALPDVLAAGMFGGVMESLQGGKFGHGFISAGLSMAVPGLPGRMASNFPLNVAYKAIVGGTVSAITGGKFANGAAYGAFAAIAGFLVAESVQSKEPVQGEEAGEVYGHGVWGIGKHGSARFYPDDPAAVEAALAQDGIEVVLDVDKATRRKYIVFSGGPDYEGRGLLGNLRGDINRGSDMADPKNKNQLIGKVYAPAGTSKDAFIKQLINNTGRYNSNRLNYDLLPTMSSGYNSNSYFHGLINSAGGRIEGDVNWQYEGFRKPVPANRF